MNPLIQPTHTATLKRCSAVLGLLEGIDLAQAPDDPEMLGLASVLAGVRSAVDHVAAELQHEQPRAPEPEPEPEPEPDNVVALSERSVEVRLPELRGTIDADHPTVSLREWLVSDGDRVEIDQPLITIETDAMLIDIPAPIAGTVASTSDESEFGLGDLIATIDPAKDAESA